MSTPTEAEFLLMVAENVEGEAPPEDVARLRAIAAQLSASPGMPSPREVAHLVLRSLEDADGWTVACLHDGGSHATICDGVAALLTTRDAQHVTVTNRLLANQKADLQAQYDELRAQVAALEAELAKAKAENKRWYDNAVDERVRRVASEGRVAALERERDELRDLLAVTLARANAAENQTPAALLEQYNAALRRVMAAEAASRLTGETACQCEALGRTCDGCSKRFQERGAGCEPGCGSEPMQSPTPWRGFIRGGRKWCTPDSWARAAAPPTGEAPAALTAAELAEAKRRAEKLVGPEALRPAREVATSCLNSAWFHDSEFDAVAIANVTEAILRERDRASRPPAAPPPGPTAAAVAFIMGRGLDEGEGKTIVVQPGEKHDPPSIDWDEAWDTLGRLKAAAKVTKPAPASLLGQIRGTECPLQHGVSGKPCWHMLDPDDSREAFCRDRITAAERASRGEE